MKIITDPDKIDKLEWSNFVINHPKGNIFQTPQMYEVYKYTKNYEPLFVSVTNEKGLIIAILLAVVQKEFYGPFSLFTARSVIFGAPLVNYNNQELLDIILKEYNKLVKGKAIYSQFRNFSEQLDNQKQIFINNGYKFENHLNIKIDLKIGVTSLWKETKRNRKDGIHKALKQGFIFEVKDKLDSVDYFYYLFEDLYRKNRIPYPDKSFFVCINSYISNNLKWFILSYNNKPSIILCSFIYNKTLYAFSVGILQDSELMKLRPVDLFYWEVIKWGAENQISSFDWMGAGNPEKEYGVRKFKLQYGGEQFNPGRYEKIHYPIFYKLAVYGLKIWSKIKI
jgi:serine/alanine adding enzyme